MNSFLRGFDIGFTSGFNNLFMNNFFGCGFMSSPFNVWNFNMPFISTPIMNFSVFPGFPTFTPMPMSFSTPIFTSVNTLNSSYTPFPSYTPQDAGLDTFSSHRSNNSSGSGGGSDSGTSSSQSTNAEKTTTISTVPHYSKITEEEMQSIYGKQYDYDITTKSNLTAEQINKFIEKNFPNSVLKDKGQVFVDAENKYDISALAMLGICGIETSYGTKGHAKDGLNNVVNIQRSGYNKAKHGNDRFRKFESVEACIMELARLLKENFVDNSGNKDVPHFKKLYQVNARYCPASEKASQSGWAKSVTNCMNTIKEAIEA